MDYYFTYLDLIQRKRPELEVLAISHSGYQSSGDFVSDGKRYPFVYRNLDFQVQHKIEIIKDFVSQEESTGPVELRFLSHSFGSYITQRTIQGLLKDAEIAKNIAIKFVGLVCPTVYDIAGSDSGQKFVKLAKAVDIVRVAVFLRALLTLILPVSVIRYIIRSAVVASPVLSTKEALESHQNSIDGTHSILKSKRIVQQALEMTKDEMKLIDTNTELNDWFFKTASAEHGFKIWSFFAILDHWVSDETRAALLERYHDQANKNIVFQIGSDTNSESVAITHSFCVDKSVEFAEITVRAMDEA